MTPKAQLIFLLNGKSTNSLDIYALREAEDKKKFDYDAIYRKVYKKETTYEIVSICQPGVTEPHIRKLKNWDTIVIADTQRKKEIEINEKTNIKVLNNRFKLLPFSERTIQKLNKKKDSTVSSHSVMISTSNLSNLPTSEELKTTTRSLAVLDIILKPLSNRIYFFDGNFKKGIEVGSMQHHNGDHYYAIFTPDKTLLKGFKVDSPMNPDNTPYKEVWEGVLNEVDEDLIDILEDEDLEAFYTTFCVWKGNEEKKWKIGTISFPGDDNDPDGSKTVLEILNTNDSHYTYELRREFGRLIPFEAVKSIFKGEKLTAETVKAINSNTSFDNIIREIKETGHPV